MKNNLVIGIDPGLEGAFAYFLGKKWGYFLMPLKGPTKGREVDFEGIHKILETFVQEHTVYNLHVYLERAVSFGMGTKGAFNYGRGYAALEIAIKLLDLPVTYVEPGKWTKKMHEGIDANFKPKAKSAIAIQRLYPAIAKQMPKARTGTLHAGIVDATLIAGYGLKIND